MSTRSLPCALLCLSLGCAQTQKSAGVGLPMRDLPGVSASYTTTRQLPVLSAALTAGPAARYKLSDTSLDVGFGLQAQLQPKPRGPGAILGFDALNAGCTRVTCFGGTGGMHGGVFYPLTQTARHDLYLQATLDHDVRIGPVSSTTFLLSVRFHPNLTRL